MSDYWRVCAYAISTKLHVLAYSELIMTSDLSARAKYNN